MIERRLYKKNVITEEFSGLKNHLTGDIEISKLTIGMPRLELEERWKEIRDLLVVYSSMYYAIGGIKEGEGNE